MYSDCKQPKQLICSIYNNASEMVLWVYQWQGHELTSIHILLVREVKAWRALCSSVLSARHWLCFVGLFYRLTRPCLYKYMFLIPIYALGFWSFWHLLLEITHGICLSIFFYSGRFDYLCSNTAMFSVHACVKSLVFLQGDLDTS